jgi:hypothetical protein
MKRKHPFSMARQHTSLGNSRQTPWYLTPQFFSLFFGSVLTIIVVSWLVQGAALILGAQHILKQDFSKGLVPVVEKVLCGEPKCLKEYFK